jgi:thiol-disulfide isomerase/thioredoxin
VPGCHARPGLRIAAASLLGAALALTPGCSKAVDAPPAKPSDTAPAKPGAARVSKGIGPNIGYTAPDFALEDLDGRVYRLSDHRGQVVLLNFWATWCGPCRIEMPTLQAIQEDYANRDFQLLAVAGDLEGAEVVGPYMKSLGLTFPGLLDAAGKVEDLYFVNALPMSFLLDRNGVIVYKLVGFFDWNQPKFRGLVERLLDEA